MALILRLASSLDKRPHSSILKVNLEVSDNQIIFKLITDNSDNQPHLEKWSLLSCSQILKESKGYQIKVI